MTENEYVNARNVSLVLTAREVLRNVILVAGTSADARYSHIVNELFLLTSQLHDELGAFEGAMEESRST